MNEKKISPLYKAIKWLIWVVYPKMEVVGCENLPADPAIVVGNHTQMNGPIACELYFPGMRYTWCAGEGRARIRDYLMTEITDMARSLPAHRVVPYRNIPKKLYPLNISHEEGQYEGANCLLPCCGRALWSWRSFSSAFPLPL